MVLRRWSLPLSLAAALAATAPAARADVIYQDFDPAAPGPYSGGLFVAGSGVGVGYGDTSVGLIFTAGATGPLATASVRVEPAGGVPGFPAGTYDADFDLSLYAAPASGIAPGPLIEDLGDYAAGAGPTVVTAASATSPILTAGASYYLVMSGADPASALLWLASTTIGTVYGDEGGDPVASLTDLPTGSLASGAAAVPEPASLAALAAGLAALGAAGLGRLRSR